MNHKQFKQQQSIIDGWISEAQKAYNIEDVSDSHIVSYLAQKQMGLHGNERKSDITDAEYKMVLNNLYPKDNSKKFTP